MAIMKAPHLPLLLACIALTGACAAQTSDFPGASDMRNVARPEGSTLIGGMHIDNDEFAVPTGPVERGSDLGKTVTATGPVDRVAYAGPKSASSLTTYTNLSGQLVRSGFTEVWTCARKTCGSAYSLAGILFQPLVDTIHTGSWGGMIINDLSASNDDVRYGTFRKGNEYMLVLAVLAPGKNSGALLIRVNGPADDAVLREMRQTAAGPDAVQQTSAKDQSPANDAVREKAKATARSIFDRVPHR